MIRKKTTSSNQQDLLSQYDYFQENRNKIGLLKALHSSWVDFMTHTSMHGLKYICEDGRRIIERLFWISIVSTMIITATFMVLGIYKRYTTNPIMTKMERTHYPTWLLPFPAVTICNRNRILKSKAKAVAEDLVLPAGTTREEVLEYLKLLNELMTAEFPTDERFFKLQNILDENRYTISQIMLKLNQNCTEMFDKCSWENQVVDCSTLFDIHKSYHGYCCSFNYRGPKDIASRSHSELVWRVEGEAKHSRLHGPGTGLTVLINAMTYEYFASESNSNGMMVIIHHPDEFPDETAVEKFIPLNKEIMVPVNPYATYSTDDVRDVPQADRKCIFYNEHPLYFFPDYRDRNCVTECKMNYTLEVCGCFPYYYPDNGLHRPCDLTDLQCLHEKYEILHTRRPHWYQQDKKVVGVDDSIDDTYNTRASIKCYCPKNCNYVVYEADNSVGNFKATSFSVGNFITPATNVTDRILLHVYLEFNFSQLTKIDVVNTWGALLSNLGGVCCLFLGCSFVTVVEVFYFLVIRLQLKKEKTARHSSGDDCTYTPKKVRDLRYPSVRQNNARLIRVLPTKF